MDTLLNYILMAVLVAIIFHVIMKSINRNGEGMTGQPISGYSSNSEKYAQLSYDSLFNKMTVLERPKVETPNEAPYIGCNIDRTENEVAGYIKDLAFNGRFLSDDENKDGKVFTQAEIDQYRDNFFNFRSTTMHNSHQEDAVDRINEMRLTGEQDQLFQGERIADVFDRFNNNVIIDPESKVIDLNHARGAYMKSGHKTNYYTNYSWMYDNDSVNNGGKFYDDIEADDKSILIGSAL